MRSGIDEASDPKYALIERERRWLVDSATRPDLAAQRFTLIEDRYITDTRLRLRRMTDSATGASSLKLTKKYDAADPLARPIITAYLTEAEFAVFDRLPGASLTKRRYKVAAGANMFGVDQFLGSLAPLELAEIEWPDDDGLRALHPPIWAIRDISDDPRYQGGALSHSGLPKD
ncbi:CYTH domain-containing protein [Sphingomonas sp. UYAg733]